MLLLIHYDYYNLCYNIQLDNLWKTTEKFRVHIKLKIVLHNLNTEKHFSLMLLGLLKYMFVVFLYWFLSCACRAFILTLECSGVRPTDNILLFNNHYSQSPQFSNSEGYWISPFHYMNYKLILMVLILCGTEFKAQHDSWSHISINTVSERDDSL